MWQTIEEKQRKNCECAITFTCLSWLDTNAQFAHSQTDMQIDWVWLIGQSIVVFKGSIKVEQSIHCHNFHVRYAKSNWLFQQYTKWRRKISRKCEKSLQKHTEMNCENVWPQSGKSVLPHFASVSLCFAYANQCCEILFKFYKPHILSRIIRMFEEKKTSKGRNKKKYFFFSTATI